MRLEHVITSAALTATLTLVAFSGRGDVEAEVKRLRVENALLRNDLLRERSRAAQLESELARQGRARLERELAWRDFSFQIGRLRGGAAVADELAQAVGIEPEIVERETDDRRARVAIELAAARERAELVRSRLNALLRIESVDAFDLFDIGLLESDRPERSDGVAAEFGAGPVVMRLLDHRGVLAGSLRADRLHLEASRSGHSVVLVLTGSVTQVGSTESTFAGSSYRIPLRHVDPAPFLLDCAELFDRDAVEYIVDDGRWSRSSLRLTLNRLLARSVSGLEHRLIWVGGVVGSELRDVEIAVLTDQGVELRRVVADGLAIEVHDDHVRLVLRDGLTVRGDTRVPFLDGRMKIVLPGAVPSEWLDAHLPVFGRGPTSETNAAGERPSESVVDTNRSSTDG